MNPSRRFPPTSVELENSKAADQLETSGFALSPANLWGSGGQQQSAMLSMPPRM
jgi:hypothetical protein